MRSYRNRLNKQVKHFFFLSKKSKPNNRTLGKSHHLQEIGSKNERLAKMDREKMLHIEINGEH